MRNYQYMEKKKQATEIKYKILYCETFIQAEKILDVNDGKDLDCIPFPTMVEYQKL